MAIAVQSMVRIGVPSPKESLAERTAAKNADPNAIVKQIRVSHSKAKAIIIYMFLHFLGESPP